MGEATARKNGPGQTTRLQLNVIVFRPDRYQCFADCSLELAADPELSREQAAYVISRRGWLQLAPASSVSG